MGIHVIAELLGVEPGKISRVEYIRRVLDRVVSESDLNHLSSIFHQFEPQGVSAVYLLSESHVSIHTWPEYGYVALDIFTCGSNEKALKALDLFLEEFKPKTVEKQVIRRDLYAKSRDADSR